jgi:predicted metal-binding protein
MTDHPAAPIPAALITVCDTCRFSESEKAVDGLTGGARFAAHVEAAAADAPGGAVRRFSCLMGCDHHCNAGLSAPGKLTYVLGRFAPTAEDAAALVEYAVKYAGSETGTVPYREWPKGVKGHFISRMPPP